MGHHSEAFIGIDTAKLRNAVAIAEAGRRGEVRYLGEVDASEAATRKLVTKLAGRYRRLAFCYEAGPTGYGLAGDREPWSQMPGGGAIAGPEESWQSREDQPTRCGGVG